MIKDSFLCVTVEKHGNAGGGAQGAGTLEERQRGGGREGMVSVAFYFRLNRQKGRLQESVAKSGSFFFFFFFKYSWFLHCFM